MFDNESALLDAIRKDMELVLFEVGNEIKENVKQNVRDVVYDPWEDYVRKYKRRGEFGGFLGSWTNRKLSEGNSKKVTTVIFSDPGLMSDSREGLLSSSDDIFMMMLDAENNPDDFLNPMNIPDRRDIMDEAIAEGTDWDFLVPLELSPYDGDPPENWWTHPRDYWSPSIAYVDRNLDGIVSYSLAKHFEMNW